MTAVRFAPRILYLCTDPERVRAQLSGQRLQRAEAGALRDDVSTDEITPLPSLVHFDDALALNTRMRAEPWVPRTELAYADRLLRSGDARRGRELLGRVRARGSALGMARLVADADARREGRRRRAAPVAAR